MANSHRDPVIRNARWPDCDPLRPARGLARAGVIGIVLWALAATLLLVL